MNLNNPPLKLSRRVANTFYSWVINLFPVSIHWKMSGPGMGQGLDTVHILHAIVSIQSCLSQITFLQAKESSFSQREDVYTPMLIPAAFIQIFPLALCITQLPTTSSHCK